MAAGPEHAPVVLLLHGFPEFWYGWHRQMEPLASAGFRVIVPDQRGYNLSSKPGGVRSYAIAELVSDVIAIADQLNQPQIFLGGHDWGAAVAWNTALVHPERIAKLAILNVPHPSVMRRFLATNPGQMRRSWYILAFQIPFLPEALLSARNFRIGVSALERSSAPGTFSSEDFAQYRGAWSQKGALAAMIHWYRAALRFPPHIADPTVKVPTRILWGQRDRFLLAEMAEHSARHCMDARLSLFPNASHWLQHEEPLRVSELLIDFFCSP
jgi:pimeloyl-ACP methyl ester carboxylesterase